MCVSLTTHRQDAANARCLSWSKLGSRALDSESAAYVHASVCTDAEKLQRGKDRKCYGKETFLSVLLSRLICFLVFLQCHDYHTICGREKSGVIPGSQKMSWLLKPCSESGFGKRSWLTWYVCLTSFIVSKHYKMQAVTTNTMFGKISWLNPNFTLDSQSDCTVQQKVGL